MNINSCVRLLVVNLTTSGTGKEQIKMIHAAGYIENMRIRLNGRRVWRQTEQYKGIQRANLCFLSCILFEVAGIFTMPFLGTVGAQMAIYFMTFLFALFLAGKHRDELLIPIENPRAGTLLFTAGMTVCGIPVAMLLNALAELFSTSGADTVEDVAKYPLWLAIIAFAIVPAFVEEYVFRGVVLGEYLKIETGAAVLISSIFFALLHFSLGSVLYGFFFGCVFALVRTATGNLTYTVVMHLIFNSINVLLSYASPERIPEWVVGAFMIVGIVGFIVLCVIFFRKNRVELAEKSSLKRYQLITKEGYVTMGICFVVMGMLLMM